MKAITAAQMREIDERAEKEFGVSSADLMDHAGRAAAEEAAKMLALSKGKKAVVVCGRGNNGGDGIACARHLKEKGIEVEVFCVPKGDKPPKPEVRLQMEKAASAGIIIRYMDNVSIELPPALETADLIIDALLGTGATGKPSGPIEKAIQKIMKAGKPILALDVPSGISADTGHHSGVFITALKTVTFGLPKQGLLKPHAQRHVGELVVADIGHPKELLTPYL